MLALKTIIKQDWLFLTLILLIALAIRLDLVIASHFAIDSDEAIVGLMAKHISEGQTWPIFYYGQHYMGSLEAILISFLGLFIGLENYTLKYVPLAFSLAFVLITYLTAFELSNKIGARLAGLLIAIPPVTLAIWSTKARGGFIEVIAIGSLAMLLLIRALKYDQVNFKNLAMVAFLLGLGWWVNNQILYFMIPVFLSVLGYSIYHLRFWQTCKFFLWSIFCFLIGSLPFWIYNLQNNFASMEIFSSSEDGKGWEYLGKFFDISLPILVGARNDSSFNDSYPGSTSFVVLIYLFLVIAYLGYRFREVIYLGILKFNWKNPQEILSLMIVLMIMIVAGSSYGHLAEAPRYLLPIYFPLIVLTGSILAKMFQNLKVPAYLLLVLIITINLVSTYYPERNNVKEPLIKALDRASVDHQELITWLHENDYRWVKTNYWIGYRLAFETKETIRFMVFDEPYRSRIPEYEDEGEQYRDQAPYVLVKSQAGMLRRALEIQGYTYEEKILSEYFVIYNIKPKQTDLVKLTKFEQVKVNTNYNSETARQVLDQDLKTRWGSASPQNQTMFMEIDFPEPQELRAFTYHLADWITDYPRELQIWIIDEHGIRSPLISGSDYYFIRYLLGSERRYSFYFDPIKVKQIRLEQNGTDPFFDWSIAELEFFQ